MSSHDLDQEAQAFVEGSNQPRHGERKAQVEPQPRVTTPERWVKP